MRILSISNACCGRVWKQGMALEEAGHDVIYMYNRVANSDIEQFLKNVTIFSDPNTFVMKIQQIKDIDIIHCHNEPDWYGHLAKKHRPDVPIVFDAHDLFSVRLPHIKEKFQDEVQSFKVCDAFVYPSYGYQKHCAKLYKDFGVDQKPNLVLYSWPNAGFVHMTTLPRFGGIVYEGGLRVKEPEAYIPDQYKYHHYRDFNLVFNKLTDLGFPVMVFPGNGDALIHHGQNGALVTSPLPYVPLMEHLGRFDWGLVGSPAPDNLQWHYSMPHKFLEYLAVGLPVIVFNAHEMERFVKKHRVGIVLDKFEHLRDRYRECVQLRRNVAFLQKMFTMENHINDLVALYKELL